MTNVMIFPRSHLEVTHVTPCHPMPLEAIILVLGRTTSPIVVGVCSMKCSAGCLACPESRVMTHEVPQTFQVG